MAEISSFRYQQLCLLSKPKCNRSVYRLLKKNKIRSIVEFGLGDTKRAKNMIAIANKFSGSNQVRYTGIDLFDARETPDSALKLLDVHKEFSALNAKIQLVPGRLNEAIPRIANTHLRTDLILISGEYQKDEINSCWEFFPRMLCATSILLLQAPGDLDGGFQTLTRMELERIVKRSTRKEAHPSTSAA